MTVFVLAGSFIESILVNSLEYLLNIQADKIIFIEENHSYDEMIIQNNEKIILCKNIEEAIEKSDVCVVVKSKYILDSTFLKVKNLSEKKQKVLLELSYIFNREDQKGRNSLPKNVGAVPTIFNVSIGEFNSSVSTEITLHKLFSKLNINIYFDASETAKKLLKQKEKNIDSFDFGSCGTSVVIFSKHYGTLVDLINDYSLYQEFSDWNPDCLLLNVESGLFDFNVLENIFKYKYNKKVDQYIISDFFHTSSFTKESRPIYYLDNNQIKFRKINTAENKFIFASDKDFETKLKIQVFSKIALPQDIYIL